MRGSARTPSPRCSIPRDRPGTPKGVINTQRMLCSNQEMIRTVMPLRRTTSRRSSATGCPGTTRSAATTISASCSTTAARSTSTTAGRCRGHSRPPCEPARRATTVYFNVPRGYEMLVPRLRADDAAAQALLLPLADAVLRRRRRCAAGCGRPPGDGGRRLRRRILLVTGLGATESAPFALCAGANPTMARLRRRARARRRAEAGAGRATSSKGALRGPNITPGYWREAELTAAAFDEEGYYKLGDALALRRSRRSVAGLHLRRPDRRGLQAVDRHVGAASARCASDCSAHFGDLVQEVVIAGHERDEVTALVFPSLRRVAARCAALAALRRGRRAG